MVNGTSETEIQIVLVVVVAVGLRGLVVVATDLELVHAQKGLALPAAGELELAFELHDTPLELLGNDPPLLRVL